MHDHDHIEAGFEAGCPACELNEVSLQDTGRPWAYRLYQHPSMRATRALAEHPLPGQRPEGSAA